MSSTFILYYDDDNKKLTINLKEQIEEFSFCEFEKCDTVYEDEWYKIYFECSSIKSDEVKKVKVYINGKNVGTLKLNSQTNQLEGWCEFEKNKFKTQPFLLLYDLVIVSFKIEFQDLTYKEYFSDYILCLSKNKADVDNIKNILNELLNYDNNQIGEWLLETQNKRNTANGLLEGKWCKYSYRSLVSYLELLEEISVCYKCNYLYFKVMGKHSIKAENTLSSYRNVKTVDRKDFQWLMNHSEQLSEIQYYGGIEYQGKNYLPFYMKTNKKYKSYDVYENRVVVNFLCTVLNSAREIYKELQKDILKESDIFVKLQGNVSKGYTAPIITIKSYQIIFFEELLKKLDDYIHVLEFLYKQYQNIFNIQINMLTKLPRKTKTFQEVNPYSQVFTNILHWFEYGEFTLEKDRLILQVKTLDKIFEYYCLVKILEIFWERGYEKDTIEKSRSNYKYKAHDNLYQNEQDVPNTYVLSKDDKTVTIYYQPVISSMIFQNDLLLYRTTGKQKYYTPDFVLKFSRRNFDDEYVIFDSKFSQRNTILNYHFSSVLLKYSCEIGVANNTKCPKMVWLLQGRVGNQQNLLKEYHDSPLASKYHPNISCGVVSVNTLENAKNIIWNEFMKNIRLLSK